MADLTATEWYKSSYSNHQSNCVEIARAIHAIPVRDSKDPEGPALTFSQSSWATFINGIKAGELPVS
ncbi:DUF397 domain-containing protein [Kitasatospora viridis]|uniref:Uncharacterized protein DUF397 n=1 Tax=Kitasatospora viridis TaxID=281105 RepID=A0A561TSM9_9ACTN|nr:DUF397 domain-containing protein [Kitasatospora viridis]TWF90111.1 uncharacterized protein DUF397 [Kitasatospora viridis]